MFDIINHNHEVHNVTDEFLCKNKRYIKKSLRDIKKSKILFLTGDDILLPLIEELTKESTSFGVRLYNQDHGEQDYSLLAISFMGDDKLASVLHEENKKTRTIISSSQCLDSIEGNYRFLINTENKHIHKNVAFFITHAIIHCLNNNECFV